MGKKIDLEEKIMDISCMNLLGKNISSVTVDIREIFLKPVENLRKAHEGPDSQV